MRKATARHYLMCAPTYFDVTYSINPWMDPAKPVDTAVAVAQWERIRDTYLDLGHQVDLIEPVRGLPDMVFAANGATVVDRKVLMAQFRYEQRADEAAFYADWFRANGYPEVEDPKLVNEGEGDFLVAGPRILAGTGFRSARDSHQEAQEFFGVPVISLNLVDPRFYHLDTALSVLDDETVMYFPPAFSEGSQRVLRSLYPDAILADEHDAAAFGLNATSDGLHVVLPQAATGLAEQLRGRGYEPIGVEVSELLKSGGAVKCCTLELR